MSEQSNTIVFGIVRKSLEATVIHACPKCEAPGIYKADEYSKTHWPGIYSVMRKDQPVGAVCPNCGNSRRRDLELGELSASMPKWLWNMVLVVKWCAVKTMRLLAKEK